MEHQTITDLPSPSATGEMTNEITRTTVPVSGLLFMNTPQRFDIHYGFSGLFSIQENAELDASSFPPFSSFKNPKSNIVGSYRRHISLVDLTKSKIIEANLISKCRMRWFLKIIFETDDLAYHSRISQLVESLHFPYNLSNTLKIIYETDDFAHPSRISQLGS